MNILSTDLLALLKQYGFFCNVPIDPVLQENIRISASAEDFADLDVAVSTIPGRQIYYPKQRSRLFNLFSLQPSPVYYSLSPHIIFSGKNVEPVWVDGSGHAVIAWYKRGSSRILLVGLNVFEEILLRVQGDHTKVIDVKDKSSYGFAFERPNYLFTDQLNKDFPTHPWADYLGFFLAENLSRISQFPLVEPLPFGARGAVILTGDDDQALLERYQMQLDLIGDLPITYFLHHLTSHTIETLAALPKTAELGLHPDAVDEPARYNELCLEQGVKMNALAGRRLRVVRNHGFLNQGYLGHLPTWEAAGLELDSNYPGVEGTALNGSFLPLPIRKPDGKWTSHYSLLTLFGDGMIEPYGPNLSNRAAVARINQLADQIERTRPGMMVFNFHPQNIIKTKELHQAVLRIAKRLGWLALGLDSLLERLKILQHLQISKMSGNRFRLEIPQPLEGITLRYPLENGKWKRKILEPWSGKMELELVQ